VLRFSILYILIEVLPLPDNMPKEDLIPEQWQIQCKPDGEVDCHDRSDDVALDRYSIQSTGSRFSGNEYNDGQHSDD